jgi:hypothetical protein
MPVPRVILIVVGIGIFVAILAVVADLAAGHTP